MRLYRALLHPWLLPLPLLLLLLIHHRRLRIAPSSALADALALDGLAIARRLAWADRSQDTS